MIRAVSDATRSTALLGWGLRIAFSIAVLAAAGCTCAHNLRGESVPSRDGKTYFVVKANPDGQLCETVYVDGALWTHPVGAPGEITPGEHTLGCSRERPDSLTIRVEEGETFYFDDYWGP